MSDKEEKSKKKPKPKKKRKPGAVLFQAAVIVLILSILAWAAIKLLNSLSDVYSKEKIINFEKTYDSDVTSLPKLSKLSKSEYNHQNSMFVFTRTPYKNTKILCSTFLRLYSRLKLYGHYSQNKSLVDDYILQLINVLRDCPDKNVKRKSALILIELKDVVPLKLLLGLLEENDEFVRSWSSLISYFVKKPKNLINELITKLIHSLNRSILDHTKASASIAIGSILLKLRKADRYKLIDSFARSTLWKVYNIVHWRGYRESAYFMSWSENRFKKILHELDLEGSMNLISWIGWVHINASDYGKTKHPYLSIEKDINTFFHILDSPNSKIKEELIFVLSSIFYRDFNIGATRKDYERYNKQHSFVLRLYNHRLFIKENNISFYILYKFSEYLMKYFSKRRIGDNYYRKAVWTRIVSSFVVIVKYMLKDADKDSFSDRIKIYKYIDKISVYIGKLCKIEYKKIQDDCVGAFDTLSWSIRSGVKHHKLVNDLRRRIFYQVEKLYSIEFSPKLLVPLIRLALNCYDSNNRFSHNLCYLSELKEHTRLLLMSYFEKHFQSRKYIYSELPVYLFLYIRFLEEPDKSLLLVKMEEAGKNYVSDFLKLWTKQFYRKRKLIEFHEKCGSTHIKSVVGEGKRFPLGKIYLSVVGSCLEPNTFLYIEGCEGMKILSYKKDNMIFSCTLNTKSTKVMGIAKRRIGDKKSYKFNLYIRR